MASRAITAAATCAAGAVLLTTAPPRSALRALTAPAPDDPTSALVGAIALSSWVLVLWLLAAVTATTAGHLPGRAGRGAAAAARRLAPRAVRRGIEVALGLTVTGAVLGAGPAAASSSPLPADSSARPALSLDWDAAGPSLDPAAPAPALDWGSAPAAPAPAEPAPRPVVVAPGDSLWSLAARDLARRSGALPSDAAIASSWPTWWSANRKSVGADPHLLHPGTSLVPPADQP